MILFYNFYQYLLNIFEYLRNRCIYHKNLRNKIKEGWSFMDLGERLASLAIAKVVREEVLKDGSEIKWM